MEWRNIWWTTRELSVNEVYADWTNKILFHLVFKPVCILCEFHAKNPPKAFKIYAKQQIFMNPKE